MSSRTYLSIGDVLTLLREEFPDVTISKIRFLESQGLVNPERSPSGYRKFFDHDVERLRWVLRQQREHFLPLKVIRDRLADGELDDEGGADLANGKPGEPVHAQAGARAPAGGAATAAGHSPARVPRADEQPTKADEEAMARILADASRRAANMPEAAQTRRGLQVVGDDTVTNSEKTHERGPAVVAPEGKHAAGSTAVPTATARATATTTAAPKAPAPAQASARDAGGAQSQRSSTGTGSATGPAPTGAAASPAGGGAHAVGRGPGAGDPTRRTNETVATGAASIVTGASLTGEELCAASGLSAVELSGLETFGLIESVVVAGIPTYDEDALTMANLAAAFRAYGIEPRHLRPYRNAVDREMGLIEQVIIPLLRQRNPESRQRAVEAADQLASLGQSMRATLLRQALRRHMGG